MGHESCEAECDHHDTADTAAPQQATQLQPESDEIAGQKTDDGHVQHERPSDGRFGGYAAVATIIAAGVAQKSAARPSTIAVLGGEIGIFGTVRLRAAVAARRMSEWNRWS